MNFSKTIAVGRLGRDPEMKALASGQPVCSFSLAVSRVWLKEGEKQEETEWFNVVFFGKQAETISKYCQKGSMLLVEGRMKTRSWDKDGVKQYRTELIGDTFQLPPKDQDGRADDYESQSTPSEKAPRSTMPDLPDYPEEEINPEDIPF